MAEGVTLRERLSGAEADEGRMGEGGEPNGEGEHAGYRAHDHWRDCKQSSTDMDRSGPFIHSASPHSSIHPVAGTKTVRPWVRLGGRGARTSSRFFLPLSRLSCLPDTDTQTLTIGSVVEQEDRRGREGKGTSKPDRLVWAGWFLWWTLGDWLSSWVSAVDELETGSDSETNTQNICFLSLAASDTSRHDTHVHTTFAAPRLSRACTMVVCWVRTVKQVVVCVPVDGQGRGLSDFRRAALNWSRPAARAEHDPCESQHLQPFPLLRPLDPGQDTKLRTVNQPTKLAIPRKRGVVVVIARRRQGILSSPPSLPLPVPHPVQNTTSFVRRPLSEQIDSYISLLCVSDSGGADLFASLRCVGRSGLASKGVPDPAPRSKAQAHPQSKLETHTHVQRLKGKCKQAST